GEEEREEFVAERAAKFGLQAEIDAVRRAVSERRAELEIDAEGWVEIATLEKFLDEIAGAAIDWKIELRGVSDWSLASLQPSGETLDRLVEEAIDILRAEVAAEKADEAEA